MVFTLQFRADERAPQEDLEIDVPARLLTESLDKFIDRLVLALTACLSERRPAGRALAPDDLDGLRRTLKLWVGTHPEIDLRRGVGTRMPEFVCQRPLVQPGAAGGFTLDPELVEELSRKAGAPGRPTSPPRSRRNVPGDLE